MLKKVYNTGNKGIGVSKCIFFLFPLYLYTSIPLYAQQKGIQYTRDFEFKNGIYISFADFKNNSPVISSKIISNYDKNSRDFFDKVLSKNTFTYIDSIGREQVIHTNEIWGYCQNGIVYVKHGTDYNRVVIIGSICHFVATMATQVGMTDPFYYDQPFGASPQYAYAVGQFIIDFESGKITDFNVENMEKILQRDDNLYKEFSALKRKKKRDSVFLYLRKYNEKHPVYFPE